MAHFSSPQTVLQKMLNFISILITAAVFSGQAAAADISRFVGEYSGQAEVETRAGEISRRDMSVDIQETKEGFIVAWTSSTEKSGGRRKTKSYKIEFQPSGREGVFSAAMKRNLFGHTEQLDPMKGEPYVWSRITGDTLTVFSLFVAPNGDYEMQQYDRTLATGGLQLDFNSHRNGIPTRFISTFLSRQ